MTSAGSEHFGFQLGAPKPPPATRADEWQIIDMATEFAIDLESPDDCHERLKRLGATPAHERAAIVTLVVFGYCALREGFLKKFVTQMKNLHVMKLPDREREPNLLVYLCDMVEGCRETNPALRDVVFADDTLESLWLPEDMDEYSDDSTARDRIRLARYEEDVDESVKDIGKRLIGKWTGVDARGRQQWHGIVRRSHPKHMCCITKMDGPDGETSKVTSIRLDGPPGWRQVLWGQGRVWLEVSSLSENSLVWLGEDGKRWEWEKIKR